MSRTPEDLPLFSAQDAPKTTLQYPWGDDQPLYTYTRYMRNLWGDRVQKLAVDAGFSCPHRALGNRREGGCTYCNNEAFNPSYCTPTKSIRQQLEEGISFHANRYRRASRYFAYFQAYTNTYGSVAQLRALFEEALATPRVEGLVIATRPDCLPEEVLELLKELSSRTYVFVELGVETLQESTLTRIRRGHTAQESLQAIARLHAVGIPVGAHLIWGLPGETPAMMYDTLEKVVACDIQTLKFHQLQILRGTQMAEEWLADPTDFSLWSLEEYLEFLVGIVTSLPPTIAIERICAEAPPRYLLAPNWGLIRNDEVLRRFKQLLLARGAYQSSRYRDQPAV